MTKVPSSKSRRLTVRRVNELAVARGFGGIQGLARHLNRNRVTLYKALRFPSQYGPTIDAVQQALGIHEN